MVPVGGVNPGLANLAARVPSSQPGTLFGIPLATLRDAGLRKKALLIAGAALVVSIIIPKSISPEVTLFPSIFYHLVWPLIAGAAYLLVAVAPADIKQKVPPIVLEWLPFGAAFASIVVLHNLFPMLAYDAGSTWMASVGYPFLVFALLATLSNPQDQVARVLVLVGAGMMLIPWASWTFDVAFEFPGIKYILLIAHNLLQFLVFTVALASALFVVKPDKLPPALRGIDAFKPIVTAALLAWLPLKAVLLLLAGLVGGNGLEAVLSVVHYLIAIGAYFGVIMLTGSDAYDEVKRLLVGQGMVSQNQAPAGGYAAPGYPPPGQPQASGFPPPGQQPGGYPPPGQQPGGYPPPGQGQPGGYPPAGQPQAGGFPPPGQPQAGGYPSPGQGQPGGYPPPGQQPQAGGYPPPGQQPQAGGYPPPGQQPGGYPPPGQGQPGGYPPPGQPQAGGYPPPGQGQPGGYPPPGQANAGGYPPPGAYPPAQPAPGQAGGYPPPGAYPPAQPAPGGNYPGPAGAPPPQPQGGHGAAPPAGAPQQPAWGGDSQPWEGGRGRDQD